ncbi:MAG: penicillin-binding protein activator LpoB [Bacteroidota bacterium]
MNKLILPALVFVALFLTSCARQVARINPSEPIDLSGRWNDTDSRRVADKMISELTASDRYKEYAKAKGRKPAIVIGLIRNKTSEHIDAANYIKKFEVALFQSGLADLVESDEFRDKLRLERAQQQDFADPVTIAQWGKETGADLILFGEMTSETDVAGNKRVVNYITTLFLTDMETNKRIWYGQEEIKKLIRN